MATTTKRQGRVEFPSINTKGDALKRSKKKGYDSISREYKLITPMFGGGFEAANYDPITPIRASSIKGQLRFWWRATRGGQFSNIQDLKKAEDYLWGTAASDNVKIGESRIRIMVSILDKKSFSTNSKHAFKSVKGGRARPDENVAPGYISFPLRPEKGQPLSNKLIMPSPNNSKADFILKICYPINNSDTKSNHLNTENNLNAKDELEAALWAWETFGGIGARTRRGFGAITRLSDGNFNLAFSENIESWIEENMSHVCDGEWPRGVPFIDKKELSGRLAVIDTYDSTLEAWLDIVEALNKFRQMRSGMNRGLWPEADSIRSITKQWLSRDFKKMTITHKHPKTKAKLPVFPRAVLGLPIIFEFPTRWGNKRKYGDPFDRKKIKPDPYPTTLRGSSKTESRLSSPVILRPFLAKNGEAVGLALTLKTNGNIKPLENLSLFDSHEQSKGSSLSSSLSLGDVKSIDGACDKERIIKRLDGESNLPLAFISFIRRYL